MKDEVRAETFILVGSREGKRNEDGTSTLEFSLVYGLLLTMIMLVVHVGFLYNASLTVSDAADAALESYTLLDGTEASARTAAEFIAEGAPLEDLSVSMWRDEGEAYVRVRANSPSILPGLPVAVKRVASGPIEEFITEAERQ